VPRRPSRARGALPTEPRSAAAEQQAAGAAAPEYERLFRSYLSICSAAGHKPDPRLAPPSLLERIAAATASATAPPALETPGLPALGAPPAGLLAGPDTPGEPGGGGGRGGRGRGRGRGGGAVAAAAARRASSEDGGGPGPIAGVGRVVTAADGSEVPQELPVTCNGTPGALRLQELRVECQCGACSPLPAEQRLMSMTQFEVHCGLATAKKWRASVRVSESVAPGGLAIGRWFEVNGIETKGTRTGAARGL
jgi:hypothetical protein